MVIDIFVDIEFIERIKCVCKWKSPQDMLGAKYWKKV